MLIISVDYEQYQSLKMVTEIFAYNFGGNLTWKGFLKHEFIIEKKWKISREWFGADVES